MNKYLKSIIKLQAKQQLLPDYKAYLGREKNKVSIYSCPDDTSRIDPSSSNIIDTYVLTRGYDTLFRQYLDGVVANRPVNSK